MPNELSRFMAPALLTAAFMVALPSQALTLAPADQGTVHQTRSFANFSYQLSPAETAMQLSSFGMVSAGFSNRAYALFDVPAGLPAVGSAALHLLATPPAGPPNATYSFSLFDVSTPASAFQVSFNGPATPAMTALFNDLATGALYGVGALPGAPTTLSIDLSAAAKADLALASGGVFAIGVSGISVSFAPLVLSDLTLQVSAVPEPATALLWTLGAICLAAMRRRPRTSRRAITRH